MPLALVVRENKKLVVEELDVSKKQNVCFHYVLKIHFVHYYYLSI
jgi:threonine dehydrogenase-like Zn-dependent dehydrogenase